MILLFDTQDCYVIGDEIDSGHSYMCYVVGFGIKVEPDIIWIGTWNDEGFTGNRLKGSFIFEGSEKDCFYKGTLEWKEGKIEGKFDYHYLQPGNENYCHYLS